MNPTTYPAMPAPRKNRILLWLLLLFGVPVLVLLACYVGYRMSNSSAVSRLEQKARKRGEPVSLAELEKALPAVADSDNAALALLELWKEHDEEYWQAFIDGVRPMPRPKPRVVDPKVPVVGLQAERPSRTNGLSAASMAKAVQHLKEQSAYLEKLKTAVRRPACRFPTRITDGYDASLPHLSRMKGEAQLFRLEALVATERGDVDAAITALTNAARTGQLLAAEPFLISQLVRIACVTIALQGTEYLMSRRELSPAQLARIEALLDQINIADGLKTSYLGERATGLSVFGKSPPSPAAGLENEESGADALGQQTAKSTINLLGLSGADKRLMIETYDVALVQVEEDTPEAVARRKKAFEDAALKARKFPPKVFTGLLLPPMSKTEDRFASFEGRRRAGLAAVAIERYRLANGGKLPRDLEALVPRPLSAVPLDPYDGQPLRFRVGAPGYVIYSVSSDVQDNLGLERPPGATRGKDEFDDTFIIGR